KADPASVPSNVLSVAWVVDRVAEWLRHPRLGLFDVVVAASPLAAAAMEAAYDGPVAVLPVAVDASVVSRPGPVGAPTLQRPRVTALLSEESTLRLARGLATVGTVADLGIRSPAAPRSVAQHWLGPFDHRAVPAE